MRETHDLIALTNLKPFGLTLSRDQSISTLFRRVRRFWRRAHRSPVAYAGASAKTELDGPNTSRLVDINSLFSKLFTIWLQI